MFSFGNSDLIVTRGPRVSRAPSTLTPPRFSNLHGTKNSFLLTGVTYAKFDDIDVHRIHFLNTRLRERIPPRNIAAVFCLNIN